MRKGLVAVVVPLSRADTFTDSERISLAHIDRLLIRYPRFFVSPRDSHLNHPGFEHRRFADKYFGSATAHNTLMLSETFYSEFADFEYILIHHLDSLVFSDQLKDWCLRDFDLIAPPWIPGPDLPWLHEPGVGNGGLSLRKVQSFLRVLKSRERWRTPQASGGKRRHARRGLVQLMRSAWGFRLRFRFFNDVRHEIRQYLKTGGNEDRFWYKRGEKYFPEFKIAPVQTALQFGFEGNPRISYDLNQGRLPFGCHAWERYDRAFWEPFLLPEECNRTERNSGT